MESFQVDQLGNLALAGGWYRRVDTNQQGQPSSIGCGIIFYPPVQPYGYAPCVPVSGYFVSHLYARYHPYRKDRPYSSGTIATFRALDGIETQKSLSSLSTMSDPTANTPDCHSYEVPDGMGGFKQAPDAPLEIAPICWPVDETVDPGTTDPVGGGDAGDDTAPKPEEAAACRSVKARGQTIMIRRTRSNCKVAQGIVRSYVARGREPAKWICVTAASGKSRVARCAYIGRTAIIVTGRWRVR